MNQPALQITAPLLAWYDQNARILPWRENTDPYRVWISEIMLQQTRVETVKPYFDRFIDELPSIKSLAYADEEQLLKLWEGLGYYTRVRNLQKAAQIIMQEHHGKFPTEHSQILSLPGIGAYTAGAICSISFGQPTPAVDGNVQRVLARITEDSTEITTAKAKAQAAAFLKPLYTARCGDFTQSLMELGAMVCTPSAAPKCTVCPLQSLCKAYQNQTWHLYPVKTPKKPRKKEHKTVFILCCDDKIAIQKRNNTGLLSGMWGFFSTDGTLSVLEAEAFLANHGISGLAHLDTTEKTHIFTHMEWWMTGYLFSCANMPSQFTWVTREVLENVITLPTAFKKFTVLL